MRQLDLVFFSTTSNELPNLAKAAAQLAAEGLPLRLLAFTKPQLASDAGIDEFVRAAMAADAVVVTLMGGKDSCPAWDQLTRALERGRLAGKAPHFHVQPTGGAQEAWELAARHADGMGDPLWRKLNKYYRHGGVDNARQMLKLFCNALAGADLAIDEPVRPPTEGVYHPRWPGSPPLAEYLAALDPAKPTIGIWFYQNLWVNGAVEHIDAIIERVEALGGQVLPVFHYRFKDEVVGNRGADYVIEHFFMQNGRPVIDVLISPMMFSLTMASPAYRGLLAKLDVPALQAISTMQPMERWRDSPQGLTPSDVTLSIAQPEFDGLLISTPVAAKQQTQKDPVSGAVLVQYKPIADRVDQAARLALNWARLRRKPKQQRRVAIIFHHYPPRNDRIGCAAGLDSFASVVDLLARLAEDGYGVERLYESGDELAHALLAGLTGDSKWLAPAEMARRAVANVGPELYQPWREALPQRPGQKMDADWGPPPGELFVHDGKLLLPGLINGNVFIGMQPPRGFIEQAEKIYHDPLMSPPHHYLAYYRWIKHVFGADAVMHIGKHGSLEWLPGKGAGLSAECFPELAIMDLPNIYPYIVNDPGEGAQAKRRSAACVVDHMTPVMVNADLYEDLAGLDELIKDYNQARLEDPGKLSILGPMLWRAVVAADLHHDLAVDEATAMADFDEFLERLHGHLAELADTAINDGLHIMGRPPQGQALVNCLAQLSRLAGGDVPSLRQAVLTAKGLDYDQLLERRGRLVDGAGGLTGGQLIDQAHKQCLALLEAMAEAGFDPAAATSAVELVLGRADQALSGALAQVVTEVLPRLLGVRAEIDACLAALDGRFVAPGPSGAPSRGQLDALPTGRNFYSVDPQKIPTPAAWQVGVALGQALVQRCLDETGRYPENIGFILWASPTMRTKGDDVSQILWLMGVRPVWQRGTGNVIGLEPIDLTELGRPRLDVTPRISGIFRDAFGNVVELIDQAVQMVAALDEPPEHNILRAHVRQDAAKLAEEGLGQDAAWRQASLRLFGCPPGGYGAGVAALIEAKNWQNIDDIAKVYSAWSSYAYGQGMAGQQHESAFHRQLERMDVTVKNEDSREYDMMSCTDFYSYHGGLIAAARAARGQAPLSLAGDSSDPRRVKVRSVQEEAKHVFRARLLNPKWVEGLMRHGYKGAGDISKAVDVAFGWDATADVVEDWMYERLARRVALDPEVRRWMAQVNPAAAHNIAAKLLEAIKRGMWRADPQTEAQLRQLYLDAEGDMEELLDQPQSGEETR